MGKQSKKGGLAGHPQKLQKQQDINQTFARPIACEIRVNTITRICQILINLEELTSGGFWTLLVQTSFSQRKVSDSGQLIPIFLWSAKEGLRFGRNYGNIRVSLPDDQSHTWGTFVRFSHYVDANPFHDILSSRSVTKIFN